MNGSKEIFVTNSNGQFFYENNSPACKGQIYKVYNYLHLVSLAERKCSGDDLLFGYYFNQARIEKKLPPQEGCLKIPKARCTRSFNTIPGLLR